MWLLGTAQNGTALDAVPGGTLTGAGPLFPTDNWWNLDISAWPIDAGSSNYIAFINNGGTRRLHPDLGGNAPTTDDPDACYGMPYVVVTNVAAADLVAVEFDYSDESDGVDHSTGQSYPFYPLPKGAITTAHWVEGGDRGNVDLRDSQDRHLIVVDSGHGYLYELYNVFFDEALQRWFAGSGASFDLNRNTRRPDGWTSADAAGLAILPGLIRFDEVYNCSGAEIGHAFRVTVRATNGSVYPASHRAGSRVGALPMGARLRLKSSVDLTQRTSDPNVQRIFRAMRKHGLIVADNGSDMYITGTYDVRWDNAVLNPAFSKLSANDFEVVQLGYNPPATPVTKPVRGVRAGVSGHGTVSLAWDPEPGAVQYVIESTDHLGAGAVWRPVAETSTAFWSERVGPGGRFYRVLVRTGFAG
jgi:hypothetical protein